MEKRAKPAKQSQGIVVSRRAAEAVAKNERAPISVPTICTAAEQPAHFARRVSFSGEIAGLVSLRT